MNDPFRTDYDYELFLYGLMEQFSSIRQSTLIFVRAGARIARVEGELRFDQNIRLVVREIATYTQRPIVLEDYSYAVWQNDIKLYWYDPQPHPHIPSLKKNHPHHKHIPPDIKHNRVPAPEMSFTQPNLPTLIREIETLIQQQSQDEEEKSEQADRTIGKIFVVGL
ncbi:MAG: hypothetical protein HY741_24360 [Chloroflexi bacterium]|nr:hypothetical protein [Chloroflexota bacterium]